VPVPETALVQSLADLQGARKFAFPVVVKDRFSARWLGKRAVLGSVTYAYCRRLVSELAHLEHVFAGAPLGWPTPYPSFLMTLLKISVPWYPGVCYDDVWLSDPRPGVAGLVHWFWRHFAKPKTERSGTASRTR
jgi:hypothetical protein